MLHIYNVILDTLFGMFAGVLIPHAEFSFVPCVGKRYKDIVTLRIKVEAATTALKRVVVDGKKLQILGGMLVCFY